MQFHELNFNIPEHYKAYSSPAGASSTYPRLTYLFDEFQVGITLLPGALSSEF